jgi:UbiD family decarboxylase
MSFREFIEQTAESGDLIIIDKPVSVMYELANVAHALEGRPVLFENIIEHPGWRVCADPCSDRKYFSMSLGSTAHAITPRCWWPCCSGCWRVTLANGVGVDGRC